MIHCDENGQLEVISQTSHAWISGQLALLWGNKRFRKPEPWSELCLAAGQHDIGWLLWEKEPELNPKNGLPFNFLDMPLTFHLKIWGRGARWVRTTNEYAALLVLRHNLFLLGLHDFTKEPGNNVEAADRFRSEQANLEQEIIHALESDPAYSNHMNERSLERNQLLIKTWDYISLLLCMGISKKEEITDAPICAGDSVNITVETVDQDDHIYSLDPWPLNEQKAEVYCNVQRCNTTFENQDEMRAYLAKEPSQKKVFTLIPG